MALTSAQYLRQLQALLPTGAAWPREDDATLTKVLHALADELARVDARVEGLVNEADPRTADEMLADWERVVGLPDRCSAGVAQTVAERRLAVAARLAMIGGQSRAYFISVAAAMGIAITITEFAPETFKWRINAPMVNLRHFRAGQGRCGDRLRTWGDPVMECRFRRLKPAHTQVIFGYV